MKTYYVYLLTDPRNNNQVFYCGKGTGDRWKSHLGHWSGNGKNNPTENKIRKMQQEGYDPGVIFLYRDITNENEAYALESKYIAENFSTLTNLKIDSYPPSAKGRIPWNKGKKRDPKVTEKISKKQKGQKNRNFKNKELWKENISKSLTGELHPNYGKPAKNKKPVVEITTNRKFSSLTEAAVILNIKQGDISNCLAGRQNTVKGYQFRYEN
jgi:hypothetical protein